MFAPLGLGALPHQSVLNPGSGSMPGGSSVDARCRASMRAVKAQADARRHLERALSLRFSMRKW